MSGPFSIVAQDLRTCVAIVKGTGGLFCKSSCDLLGGSDKRLKELQELWGGRSSSLWGPSGHCFSTFFFSTLREAVFNLFDSPGGRPEAIRFKMRLKSDPRRSPASRANHFDQFTPFFGPPGGAQVNLNFDENSPKSAREPLGTMLEGSLF